MSFFEDVLTVTSLTTPRMRRTLNREKRGRMRNPFTKKSSHAGSALFEHFSRDLLKGLIEDGSSSSSRLLVLLRLNVKAEVFGATLKAGTVL